MKYIPINKKIKKELVTELHEKNKDKYNDKEYIIIHGNGQKYIIRKEKIHKCYISKNYIRERFMLQSKKYWILNPTTFQLKHHNSSPLPVTSIIPIRFNHLDINDANNYIINKINKYNAYFVPKIFTTTMYAKYIAIYELLKYLPYEIVVIIMSYIGGPKNLNIESPFLIPYDTTYKSKYETLAGPIDYILNINDDAFYSVESLLELVKKNIIDIAIRDNMRGCVITLSTDAYIHLYSENRKYNLTNRKYNLIYSFPTIDKMKLCRQDIIDTIYKLL